MSFELSEVDLSNLDADLVAARLQRLENLTEGLGAGVEVRRGFIHDFVLRLQSILGQALSDRMDVVGASLNPLAVSATAEVEGDVLDSTAAYYGLSRYTSTNSEGQIAIVISAKQTLLIPAGASFTTSDGRSFLATQAFAARTTATEVRSATDRLLTERTDGNYEFAIDAIAAEAGSYGSIAVGTELSAESLAIPKLVEAYAKTAFSGGIDTETDAQLIERIRRIMPAKSLSTRASITAYLTQDYAFPTALAFSTIGFGDAELSRAQRAGICSSGGTADIYMRSTSLPLSKAVTFAATAVEVVAGGKATWQVVVDRDTVPGFYTVSQASFLEGGKLTLSSITRGYDTSLLAGELVPRISDPVDAAFSRFQTATIQMTGPSEDVVVNDVADVTLQFVYLPDIAEAQNLVSGRTFRFIGGDTLVRAAIPVFVSVSIQVHVRAGVTVTNPANIRSAVANYFNSSGFPGRLHTSRLASIVHGLLPAGADVGSLEVILETLRPDGTIDRRRQTGHIDTLNEPGVSTTPRTCSFFCDPGNVVISAYEESIPTTV